MEVRTSMEGSKMIPRVGGADSGGVAGSVPNRKDNGGNAWVAIITREVSGY